MISTRIAVAGADLIGRRHIQGIQKSRTTSLAAIIDPSSDSVVIAQREGVALYRSLQECFATDRPDGVVLATPN